MQRLPLPYYQDDRGWFLDLRRESALPSRTVQTDLVFCYHVTREYDPDDPNEHGVPWGDPRVEHLWSTQSPILSARDAS